MSTVHIEDLGGNCPVQAHGSVEGFAWSFRARGTHWTLTLMHGDREDVQIACRYGPLYSAGWMPEAEARAAIEAVAPLLLVVAEQPCRRHDLPRSPAEEAQERKRFHEWIENHQKETRERNELITDNAALRERVKELDGLVAGICTAEAAKAGPALFAETLRKLQAIRDGKGLTP